MAAPIKSRTQRRMEKKQALVLLILVLAASLVSFALGVMVGRNGASTGASPPVAAKAPIRMPIARQATPVPPPATPGPAAKAPASGKEKLTFYDTLPQGKQSPMGSGINLPPGAKSAEKAPAPSAQPAAAPKVATVPPKAASTQAVTAEEPPAPPKTVSAPPKGAKPAMAPPEKAAGSHVVQVASFRKVKTADALRDRLTQKGYTAFTREVDLGAKGVWNRVYVGPFASVAEANRVAMRLKSEEKLSVLVKRR
jgi:DedD protein